MCLIFISIRLDMARGLVTDMAMEPMVMPIMKKTNNLCLRE